MDSRRGRRKPPTLRGVQALRGVAACMVVVHHAVTPAVWPNGASGVDIFFVISGLVMAVSTIGREHITHPARSFLERRVIRLVPLYWIMTMMVLLQMQVVRLHQQFAPNEHIRRIVQTPFLYIFSSLFFIPYRNSLGDIQPLLIPGWTLSFEMFFYLLFALALALRVSVVRMLTPVLVTLAITGMFHQPDWPTITVLLSPLLLEFLAGLLLGHLVLKGFRMNPILSLFLGTTSLGILLFVPLANAPAMRVLQWGIPAAILVQSVVAIEDQFGAAWPRWSLLIGDASYSIYLVHLLAFWAIGWVARSCHILTAESVGVQNIIRTTLILFSGTILISLPLYRFVEKPITNKLRRLMTSDRKVQCQVD